MSEIVYRVSLEIRDMDNEDLTNPQLIEFCKILEDSLESVMFGGWDISLGSICIEVDGESHLDDDDYFSSILQQGRCSHAEKALLQWLLKNNSCRKPLNYNLILEKEP